MTLLLVGLGNPILGDDAVGISVVRILKEKIPPRLGLEYKELSLGGLRLVEEILGYESVFIIDSIASNETTGKIRELSPEQFKETEYASSPHSTNFATALTLYKTLNAAEIPSTLRIFTIDINPEFTFRETLSPQIQRAASELAELIATEIKRIIT
jgi:hydrogenase maturation protease